MLIRNGAEVSRPITTTTTDSSAETSEAHQETIPTLDVIWTSATTRAV